MSLPRSVPNSKEVVTSRRGHDRVAETRAPLCRALRDLHQDHRLVARASSRVGRRLDKRVQ